MHVLESSVFTFNPEGNGGEALSLRTTFEDNGDLDGKKSIYLVQEITLQSYSNSVTIHLQDGSLTPEVLRRLANELESGYIKALNKQAEVQS